MGGPLPPETPMQRYVIAAARDRRRPSNASRALSLSVSFTAPPVWVGHFFFIARSRSAIVGARRPASAKSNRFQTSVFEAPPMINRPFAPSQTQHGPQTPKSGACGTTPSPPRKIMRQVVSR
jgi:hypothetical protein